VDHPNFYQNSYTGSHIEIVMQLCDEFAYVVEVRGSVSTAYFKENVKNRFCFVTKEPGILSLFFDNGMEALKADKYFNPEKYEENKNE